MKRLSQPNIWITIDKIKHTLCWSDQVIADRLQMTLDGFLLMQNCNISPSLLSITSLANSLEISIESVVTGKICYETLKAHQNGQTDHLPERYSVATFSKRKTTIHLLDFIETNFGWQTKKNVLNHFQINEGFTSKPDAEVNFLLPSDICEYLGKTYRMPVELIQKMGAHSALTNKNTFAGKTLYRLRSPKILLEHFFSQLVNQHFEKNQTYQIIKLTDRFCLVETRFKEELKDSLKTGQLGNIFACNSIAGTMSSLTTYLNLPSSHVTKVDCVHQGGCSCKYLIDFDLPQSIYEFDTEKQSNEAPFSELH